LARKPAYSRRVPGTILIVDDEKNILSTLSRAGD
jgi:hypothetical protein